MGEGEFVQHTDDPGNFSGIDETLFPLLLLAFNFLNEEFFLPE
jgi:hypothetical protein